MLLSSPVLRSAIPAVQTLTNNGQHRTPTAQRTPPSAPSRPLATQFQGQGHYPFDRVDIRLGTHPSTPYLNQLDAWRLKIWDEATRKRPGFPNGWLQPMDTVFQVSNQIDLMEAAARGGFPTRYRHWRWGQDFNDQYQRQRFGLGRLYEMVINANPSYAFLYDRNPVYAQKVVMAHVLGHTDFFRNNLIFSESNRNMVRVMADHKAKIEQYYQDPILSRQKENGVHPVEKFLNRFDAIEWLIDMNQLAPPSLDKPDQANIHASQTLSPSPVLANKLGVAPWMQDYLYSHSEWQKDQTAQIQKADLARKKPLAKPTRDILGYLVNHSKSLDPWQRDILKSLREESYYFAPQIRTKLMNEGWATFWHHKLMAESPNLINPAETLDIVKMMTGVEKPTQGSINPYQVGYAIFKDIYTRAAYGLDDFDSTFQPNKIIRYQDLNQRLQNKLPNEQAGLKKVMEVRKFYNDIEFIRQFFTPSVAAELGMVVTKEREEWDAQTRQQVRVKYVESSDFKKLKDMILEQYQNTFPSISLVNPNHQNQNELLFKHENPVQDLNLADTKETLSVLHEFWGRPVHLDTMLEVEQEASQKKKKNGYESYFDVEPPTKYHRQPVRLSYQAGKMEVFTLKETGETDKNITHLYF